MTKGIQKIYLHKSTVAVWWKNTDLSKFKASKTCNVENGLSIVFVLLLLSLLLLLWKKKRFLCYILYSFSLAVTTAATTTTTVKPTTCDNYQCFNGGKCKLGEGNHLPVCVCTPDRTGKHCESKPVDIYPAGSIIYSNGLGKVKRAYQGSYFERKSETDYIYFHRHEIVAMNSTLNWWITVKNCPENVVLMVYMLICSHENGAWIRLIFKCVIYF